MKYKIVGYKCKRYKINSNKSLLLHLLRCKSIIQLKASCPSLVSFTGVILIPGYWTSQAISVAHQQSATWGQVEMADGTIVTERKQTKAYNLWKEISHLRIFLLFFFFNSCPHFPGPPPAKASEAVFLRMREQHTIPNTEHTPPLSAKSTSKAFLFYTIPSEVKTDCSNRLGVVFSD